MTFEPLEGLGWRHAHREPGTALGTTAHAIRFYERRGLLQGAVRSENGYRDYAPEDEDRLRLILGLRQLDLPLDQAGEPASLCAAGRCDEVSAELRAAVAQKRRDLSRRIEELRFLDRRLAHLSGELGAGHAPRPLIVKPLEEGHV